MPKTGELPIFVNLHSWLAGARASLWRRSPINIDAPGVQTKKKRRISPALRRFSLGKPD
jgi:hypothetical protein